MNGIDLPTYFLALALVFVFAVVLTWLAFGNSGKG
jgi:ABC-type dipeptide/oligopeptide/nickel transport system permease component